MRFNKNYTDIEVYFLIHMLYMVTCVLVTQKDRLIETVLLGTHNI